MEILKQMLGVIALIFWTMSIQSKNKNRILKLQTLANIFYACQYFMLNAVSAASMNIVSTIRSIWFFKNQKKGRDNSIILLLIFVMAILIIAIFTCNSLLSIIPIIITLLYTYSTWQKNTKVIRIIFLISAFIWIFYNIIIGAYAPLVGNIIEVVSGIISIIRFDIKKEEKGK